MSGAVRALLVVLAIVVFGVVGYQLSGGSNSAARDSARCLDPRQPGCYGKEHPASGLLSGGQGGMGKGDIATAGTIKTPQNFEVPRTEVLKGSSLANLAPVSPGSMAGSGTAAALR